MRAVRSGASGRGPRVGFPCLAARYYRVVTKKKARPPLVWIDMEMTGLDVERHHVLEVAALVTDGELHELDGGLDLVVHQPESVLAGMDEWCVKQHGASGLTAASRASRTSVEEAADLLLAYLRRHTAEGRSPLCGNSVGHDRRFLDRWMPAVSAWLHYRVVDVSSVKELALRWYPQLDHFPKGERHRARDDIRESLTELRYYRERVFRERAADTDADAP